MSVAPSRIAIITGLSGAGKSTALKALEDAGFFCVDNLPPPVLAATLAACAGAGIERVALGLDVRIGGFLAGAGELLDAVVPAGSGALDVLFFDATDEALLRRFSSTRRPHPLGQAGEVERGAAANDSGRRARSPVAVLEGIAMERERLAALRARATLVVDTTLLSVHELRRRVLELYAPGGELPTSVRFVSFGFKYGAPADADTVLDVRCLVNPFFVDALRDRPGTEPDVRDFVLADADSQAFLERASAFLELCLPLHEREGRAYLTIAVGCTGGRHRSVVVAAWLAERLAERLGRAIEVVHRDVAREQPPALAGDSGAPERPARGRG